MVTGVCCLPGRRWSVMVSVCWPVGCASPSGALLSLIGAQTNCSVMPWFSAGQSAFSSLFFCHSRGYREQSHTFNDSAGLHLPVLAAPTLIAEQGGEGKLAIPYQMYKLDNGLTIDPGPDAPDPWVHLDVTLSRRLIPPRRSASPASAHFFEHMMFPGLRTRQ